jgi:small subunit ribosomal protein S6
VIKLTKNVYEGMFIFDANRYTRDPAGVPRQVEELIRRQGGEILVSRLWTEQKLAYPIKGQSKGTYWLTYFRMESGGLAELNHQVRLNDNVLRSLVLKIDPRLVDAMVSHAAPEASSEPAADEKADTKTDAAAAKPS